MPRASARADYAHASYMYVGAGEARVVRVGELFVVSKLLWPRHAVVPDFHLHHQRSRRPRLIYLSRVYLNVSDCVMHIWRITMVCNGIPREIPECDPPRTYVRTYVLCENRSSIQSLALMRSAITTLMALMALMVLMTLITLMILMTLMTLIN